MRRIFSEISKRARWRQVWLALAGAQARSGLITPTELTQLAHKSGSKHVDIRAASEAESRIHHDLMAELQVFAQQCGRGGGKLHYGATSADIEDNADVLNAREAMSLLRHRLLRCLTALTPLLRKYASVPCMGWTHLQPAEPTTLGYRFASYAQDMVLDIAVIDFLLAHVCKGKGMKGAVGTSASYAWLLAGRGSSLALEKLVMRRLGLEAYRVSTQTYPRKLDYLVMSALGSIAQTAHKFAFDIRVLQSPAIGEVSEPAPEEQIGSSAMPHKQNPVLSERVCSLARLIGALAWVAFSNAATQLLERTLDDSANRRVILPEAFLAADECLILYERVTKGLRIHGSMVRRNLERFRPFWATEPLLLELVRRGASRHEAHERLRRLAADAWERVLQGEDNPLPTLVTADPYVTARLSRDEVAKLMEPSEYVGDAPRRCVAFLQEVVQPLLVRNSPRPRHKRQQ